MGSGTGILAQACLENNFKNVLAVDVNEESIQHLKKQNISSMQSDLFSALEKNTLTSLSVILRIFPKMRESRPTANCRQRLEKKAMK